MPPIHHLPYRIDPERNRNHFYETLWKTTALELLRRHRPELAGWSLLDFGCGRGETMGLAAELGMLPGGTDSDPECVRLAAAYGPTSLLDERGPLCQFGAKSFDVVACFHVLEHVPRPQETLRQLGEVARHRLLVAVPNLSRPRDMIRRRNWDEAVNEGHLQSWDHGHFRNLAERHCGLRLLAWGFDATVVPPLSNAVCRLLGEKAAIRLETGLFSRLWPYGSNSVIALLEPV